MFAQSTPSSTTAQEPSEVAGARSEAQRIREQTRNKTCQTPRETGYHDIGKGKTDQLRSVSQMAFSGTESGTKISQRGPAKTAEPVELKSLNTCLPICTAYGTLLWWARTQNL